MRNPGLIRRLAFVLLTLGLGGLFWAAAAFERSEASGSRWLAVLVPVEAERRHSAEDYLHPRGSRLVSLTLNEGGVVVDEIATRIEITGTPAVSFDGRRILFPGREDSSSPSRIWEMRADGSGLRRVADWDTDCVDPAYLPDGSVVFGCVATDGRPSDDPIPISIFRLGFNGGLPERITFGSTQDRIRGILPDGRILYRRIRKPSEPATMMAVRPDGTEMARYISKPPFHEEEPLFAARIDGRPETGVHLREVDGSGRRVFRKEGYHVAELVSGRPSPLPPIATSVVDTSKPYGFLLCLNATASEIPSVREAVGLAEVRVLDDASGTVMGRAPIEEDGSFFLKVPADRPLRLELIDRGGAIAGRQGAAIWVRPNETRGCVGCHESRTLAQENRSPMAIRGEPKAIGTWVGR